MTIPRPTNEQLDLLRPMERACFRLAEVVNNQMKWASESIAGTFSLGVSWLICGRRLRVSGVDELGRLDFCRGLLLVANHRSFFDFYAIMTVLFTNSRVSRRIYFPVRAEFFYQNPVGAVLNLFFAGMAMFPPVLRDGRSAWNRYGVERMIWELNHGGGVVGIHPEGKRGTLPDPYAQLPPKPGVGQIILNVDNPQVVPVFIIGPTNSIIEELRRNWLEDPRRYPVDVAFGAPLDFSDLKGKPNDRDVAMRASERCMEAIRELAEMCRRIRESPEVPPA